MDVIILDLILLLLVLIPILYFTIKMAVNMLSKKFLCLKKNLRRIQINKHMGKIPRVLIS